MSAIPFTDKELKRALRELSYVATSQPVASRTNAHRLLLFYAVECGLKAVLLKRECRNLYESADISKTGHNLQMLLKNLHPGATLSLPDYFNLSSVTKKHAEHRRDGIKFGDLHQAWRYGGKSQLPTDTDCELKLQNVLNWIHGELK